jgi:type IV fimbrial biogenesis protein FimT
MRRGYTFIELLITLIIAALLAMTAIPAWNSLIGASRATGTINSFASTLATARSAAISFRSRIRACPGQETRCGARNTWNEGTLVFHDTDDDRIIDAGETLITSLPGFDHGQLSWRSFRNRSDLLFVPGGFTDWLNGSFLYCAHDGHPEHARMLIINAAGRIRHAPDRNRDGVREDASGKALSCPREIRPA